MSINENISLYSWKIYFGLDDLRKVTNTVTFVHEQVLVPHQIMIKDKDSATKSSVLQKINELREIGAITTWEVEGAFQQPSALGGKPDVIVGRDDYLKIHNRVNERLLSLKKDRFGINKFNYDGISEVVQGKHAIVHQELGEYLGCRSILNDSNSDLCLRLFNHSLGSQIELANMIAEVLPENLGFPDITDFPIEKIEVARRSLKEFRSYFITEATKQSTINISSLEDARDRVVEQIAKEYWNAKKNRLSVIGRSIWFLKKHTNLISARNSDPISLLLDFSSQ